MSKPFLGILSKRRGAPVVALVRYVRVRQAVGVTGYLQVGEIQAFSGDVNVALNKSVSVYPTTWWGGTDSNWFAPHGNDGKLSVPYETLMVGQTAPNNDSVPTTNAWILIDLGTVYNISSLTIQSTASGIFNGNSIGYDTLENATINLEDASNNVLKSYTLAGVNTLQSFTVTGVVAYVPPFVVANADIGTDYTITTSGGRTFYNFLATGKSMTITNTVNQTVDYFALGGGGGGGACIGGGGGGGGLQQATGYTLTEGTRTVVIGGGGVGGIRALNQTSGPSGTNGEATTFGSSFVSAAGGGGGGSYNGNASRSGGCGGGGGYESTGAAGTLDRGYAGGNGSERRGAGGGGIGGIGGNGGLAAAGGTGGIGMTYEGVQYGGGGGGGPNAPVNNTTVNGGFGSFGGGNGVVPGLAGSGAQNRGGGGGGGRYIESAPAEQAGSGGSGIFIISHLT